MRVLLAPMHTSTLAALVRYDSERIVTTVISCAKRRPLDMLWATRARLAFGLAFVDDAG
jgi:hypothetical protein